ncbi:unnamed protein product [Adineta ricciae]|uniref:PH domain-containing protein n=1 Tax=Adineta ricciae TaxID=249248 RepID=A0A815FMY1_ADIRI|nr:unnamed protein product [Adineta ricciae]
MSSSSLPDLPNYVFHIQCLIPPSLSRSSSVFLKSSNSNSAMTTSTKPPPTNSYGISPLKSSTSQTTCNICKRLLYSFEEILICRVCDGSYHWRCVKPEMTTHYGENAPFVCDKCDDNLTGTSTNSLARQANGGIKIKSLNSSEADYREFANVPSKLNATPTRDTAVVNAVRYFEEKQQQQSPQKLPRSNEIDGQYSTQANGHFTDDSKSIQRIQPQRNLHLDNENTSLGMFQANYQYTPLKEYAAMKNGRSSNNANNNSYQTSPPSNGDRQFTSQYNNGLRYTSHTYDSNKTQHAESPIHMPSHFTTTTNFNVNEKPSHTTTYLSAHRENESSTYRPISSQLHTDHHSTVESDSGIVMTNTNHLSTDENQIIEKKLTTLVQRIGRQLETDAQKLSDKLETKLKNLENMIHQQTYVIRQQDEVIERLKTKISKIETERDHFRDRLSYHEQSKLDEKKYLTTDTEESIDRKTLEFDDQQQTLNDISGNRKFSTTSSVTTDNSKRSSKKTPAPRVDQHTPPVTYEHDPTVSKLITVVPTNQERPVSDVSSPTIATQLATSVPLVDRPAASSRLDNIIHQSNTVKSTDPSSYYNVAELRHADPRVAGREISIDQVMMSVHGENDDDAESKPKQVSTGQLHRSSSSSSSSSFSSEPLSKDTDAKNAKSTNDIGLSVRNTDLHRSLQVIPRKTSQTEQVLNPSNKTASLEIGSKLTRHDDPSSIYITPREATHPASQYVNATKGWLRKQNRESFFKRVERYYCVLSKNILLMHKNENDRIPHKAINLKGATVLQYDDQKHGPSLELTWSTRQNNAKHYHLYGLNAREVEQWAVAIQGAINNLNDRK